MLNWLQQLTGQVRRKGVRSLTWVPGQVFNATVIKHLEGDEALVRIDETTLRVRLEVPLRTGEQIMLQVQPSSSDQLIQLKPAQSSQKGVDLRI